MERTAGRKLVFLGPSLGLAEARGLCPDAEFLPPIRFGDLYALSCEPPGQVLIVDGVFHDSTPVWQREILQLLQTGWRVLGASSMGALRALELEPYGMIGLGSVFEWYRAGRIEGDDEVALLHGTADMDYLPLTLPLVDVRHALGGLETQGALAPTQVSGILRAFKRMGHEVRTVRALLALVRTEGADVAAVRDRLSDRAHSLKAQDARLALRVLAGRLPLPAAGVRWPDPIPPPVEPEALFQRRIRPLAGPPLEVSDVLRTMAQQPEPWLRPQREGSRPLVPVRLGSRLRTGAGRRRTARLRPAARNRAGPGTGCLARAMVRRVGGARRRACGVDGGSRRRALADRANRAGARDRPSTARGRAVADPVGAGGLDAPSWGRGAARAPRQHGPHGLMAGGDGTRVLRCAGLLS